MSLINQMLSDLQERRGGLPSTGQTVLSGLIATDQPDPPRETHRPRTGAVFLLFLLLVSALFVKRETLSAWLTGYISSLRGASAQTGASPPSTHSIPAVVATAGDIRKVEASSEQSAVTQPNIPAPEAIKIQSESTVEVMPADVPPATAEETPKKSETSAEISQLSVKKEDSGVALELRLSAPVQYALQTDQQGIVTLRMHGASLQEGYPQSFEENDLIHDIGMQPLDDGDLAVRFSLHAGAGAPKTEITVVPDGGYLLTVHCHEDIAPLVSTVIASPQGGSPSANALRPEKAQTHSKTHERLVSKGKREPQTRKETSDAELSDTPAAEPAVVESEAPGGFHKVTRAAAPADHKARLYESAETALRAGDRTQALTLAMQALEADDTAVAPRLLAATMLMEDKRWEEARAQLETGLSHAPGNRDYKVLYARLLSETNETGKAIELLTRDAPAPADDPDYHALIAALMERTGRHDDAIVSYRRLLSVQPQNGLWWAGLGISLSAAGQREEAHQAFNRALTDRNLPDRMRQYLNDQLQQLRAASS